MADLTQDALDKAAALATEQAPAPSLTDIMPAGADTIAGKPAAPASMAVFRITESVTDAVRKRDGCPVAVDEAGMLVIWLRLRAATPKGRRDVWREARDPLAMYAAFVEWVFAVNVQEFMQAATENAAALEEMQRVATLIGGGDDDPANPPKTGATG